MSLLLVIFPAQTEEPNINMQDIHVIKIGGNVIQDRETLAETLSHIANLDGPLVLVHGGGKHVTEWMQRLGAKVSMVDGRRITDALSLQLAVMNYAGLINKEIVSLLQKNGRNALGLSGADLNIIRAKKRVHPTIDFGFVGDVESINAPIFHWLLEKGILPVCCAITHDEQGQLLNTNADTIATEIAIAMGHLYNVHLWYCFEKKGVLTNLEDEDSVVNLMTESTYQDMLDTGQIHTGMKPKLENCMRAVKGGVKAVYITNGLGIKNIPADSGTKIML